MNTTDAQSSTGPTVPAALYLLQRRDGIRFKIGWALDPLTRVQRLPEFLAEELDLQASHVVWLPTPMRARQFERALHRSLAMHRVVPSHMLDGHTEWFLPAAHRTAIRLIRQMPTDAQQVMPPPVLPFRYDPGEAQSLTDATGDGSLVLCAQDVLWGMEDLLVRASAHCDLHVATKGDVHTVHLLDWKERVKGELETLRWSFMDIERFRWRVGEQYGDFVQLMHYEEDDLVLTLTAMRQIRAWADGALEGQTLSLLQRLRALARRPVRDVKATGKARRTGWR